MSETKTSPATEPAAEQGTADADRVAELEAEVEELRSQLAATGRQPTGRAAEPSFKFTQGMADELATTGRTISPFGGIRYVGSSPDDAREATLEEFNAAKPKPRPAGKPTTKPAAKANRK